MKLFDIKSPEGWQAVLTGEVLQFDATEGEARRVELTVNTTAAVTIYVADNEDMEGRKLVAHSDGLFALRVTIRNRGFLQFVSTEGPIIYVRGVGGSHVVESVADLVFTTVEPQGRRNTDFDRMMMLMRHNEKVRQQQLDAEIQTIRRERADAKAEREAPAGIEPETKGNTDEAAQAPVVDGE